MVSGRLLVIVVPSGLLRISVTICHLIFRGLGLGRGVGEWGSYPSSLAHRSAVPASTTVKMVPLQRRDWTG
jgi:hypothetical protein